MNSLSCVRVLCAALNMMFVFALLTASQAKASERNTLRLPAPVAGTEQLYLYFHQALSLAIDETAAKDGTLVLVDTKVPMVQRRQMRNIANDSIDVMWSITTPSREEAFDTVYFPLLGGLFSYRVCLVSKSDLRFMKPVAIDTLRTLVAVLGQDWPDYTIMRRNGFTVKAAEYQASFRLLEEGYIDYFPRSIMEVNDELALHPQLTVEKDILLYYPNLMFFFVKKDRSGLAQRIQRGLNKATEDGRLLALLKSMAFYADAHAMMANRKEYALTADISEKSQTVLAHPFIVQVKQDLGLAEADMRRNQPPAIANQ